MDVSPNLPHLQELELVKNTNGLYAPPAFQFYVQDFITGTSDMSLEEVGAYIRLLCYQWSKGGLPNDINRIAKICNAHPSQFKPVAKDEGADSELDDTIVSRPNNLRFVIEKFSYCEDGLLRNRKLESVRMAQEERQAKISQAGSFAIGKRWERVKKAQNNTTVSQSNNDGNTNGGTNEVPNGYDRHTSSVFCLHNINNMSDSALLDSAKAILGHLNEKAGRSFRETELNLKLITSRLSEKDVTVEGVKQMIDRQVAMWGPTEMAEYLRPETLFRASKFQGYYDCRGLPLPNSSRKIASSGNPGSAPAVPVADLRRAIAILTEQIATHLANKEFVGALDDPSPEQKEELRKLRENLKRTQEAYSLAVTNQIVQ